MAATTTEAVTTAPAVPEAPAKVGAPIKAMALSLWGVVGSLLTYGIVMTAIKAASLFG